MSIQSLLSNQRILNGLPSGGSPVPTPSTPITITLTADPTTFGSSTMNNQSLLNGKVVSLIIQFNTSQFLLATTDVIIAEMNIEDQIKPPFQISGLCKIFTPIDGKTYSVIANVNNGGYITLINTLDDFTNPCIITMCLTYLLP